jgi:aminocarboxymuconate-semialdehyde decarboxylase
MFDSSEQEPALVIDVHAHIGLEAGLAEMAEVFPEGTPRLVERDGGRFFEYPNGVVNGPLPPGMVDLDYRIGEMDAAGVDLQVVSVRPQIFSYSAGAEKVIKLAAIQNEAMLETIATHPDRLNGMLSLPLLDAAASVAEIRRHLDHPAVRGVLVDSNVGGVNLDDESFGPIWAALSDANLPALVHPYQADVAGQERMTRYYLFNLIGNPLDSTIALASVIFGGVLDRYPDLRWCFVHGGGYAPYQLARWDHWKVRKEPKVSLDEPPSTRFGRLFFDSLTHAPGPLHLLADMVGWSQVMVGTDYPFDMGDLTPVDSIDRLELEDGVRQAVLSGNAQRFLG